MSVKPVRVDGLDSVNASSRSWLGLRPCERSRTPLLLDALLLLVGLGAGLTPMVRAVEASTRLAVTINGMVCSFCAQGIERNLRTLPATQNVSVDLKHHRVIVTLRPGVTIDDASVRNSIRNAGFDVLEIRRVASDPSP